MREIPDLGTPSPLTLGEDTVTLDDLLLTVKDEYLCKTKVSLIFRTTC